MLYNISFVRNDVCQAGLAEAACAEAVYAWYAMYKPDARIFGVTEAASDDKKPGKPIVTIRENYMPYQRAAQNMSQILSSAKGMTCSFYVMDERYYKNLAYPELSSDNRGNKLIIGDWYVIVRCSNGYLYYINVSHDSIVTMCAEVFSFIQNK